MGDAVTRHGDQFDRVISEVFDAVDDLDVLDARGAGVIPVA